MKYKTHLITGVCLAAVAACGSVTAFAQSKKKDTTPAASASPAASGAASSTTTSSSSATASPAGKAARTIPFHGTVSAVDTTAKTFTIAGKTSSRVFKVTDQTTVTKEGAPATFADIAAEAVVSGSYWKKGDGTLECKTVKIGGKPAGAAASPAKTSTKKKEAKTGD